MLFARKHCGDSDSKAYLLFYQGAQCSIGREGTYGPRMRIGAVVISQFVFYTVFLVFFFFLFLFSSEQQLSLASSSFFSIRARIGDASVERMK